SHRSPARTPPPPSCPRGSPPAGNRAPRSRSVRPPPAARRRRCTAASTRRREGDRRNSRPFSRQSHIPLEGGHSPGYLLIGRNLLGGFDLRQSDGRLVVCEKTASGKRSVAQVKRVEREADSTRHSQGRDCGCK